MSDFTARAARIDANLARGNAICSEVEASITLAEALLSQVKPSPWPWQRPASTRLRNKVSELIARNRRLQAESQHLITMNSLLLAENILERGRP